MNREKSNRELLIKIQELDTKLKNIREEKEKIIRELRIELENASSRHREEIIRIQQTITTLTRDIESYRTTISERDTRIAVLEQSVETYRARISELERELSTRDIKIRELEEEIRRLKLQIEEMRANG